MRVVFAGTPAFAARALEAIAAAGHEIVLVLTRPDRPAGRGLRLAASAVCDSATRLGLPVAKPASLKSEETLQMLRNAAADVMVVAAYGQILPRPVLEIPPRGCLNVHASLLPRWRGAAPIQRALMAGDDRTGVCIMQMDEGLDTGPVLLERSIAIGPRDTTASLTEALASLGASAIVDALSLLRELAAKPQDPSGATYAAKISKAEARIDWTRDGTAIDRQVRALNPSPGAQTLLGTDVVKIWSCEPVDATGEPGRVVAASGGQLVVTCGHGALRLENLQRAGGRRLPAAEFLRGTPVAIGAKLR